MVSRSDDLCFFLTGLTGKDDLVINLGSNPIKPLSSGDFRAHRMPVGA
jgi:hypothetical protein